MNGQHARQFEGAIDRAARKQKRPDWVADKVESAKEGAIDLADTCRIAPRL